MANLDKKRDWRPLHPKEQADYDQARLVVARDTVERLQKQTTPLTDAQKQEMADALNTLGGSSDSNSAHGPGGRPQNENGAAPDRAPPPGSPSTRGIELPGGRRGGGPEDSNLVTAGGSDGGHDPLQGGAAAAAPPPARAGGQLPAAVGQMMNGPAGTAYPDAPRASAGGDGPVPQTPRPPQGPSPEQALPATPGTSTPGSTNQKPSTPPRGGKESTTDGSGEEAGRFSPKLGTLRAAEALNLQEFKPEHATQIIEGMQTFEDQWGISFPTSTKKPVRKQAKGGLYVPGGDALYVGIDDPANNAVHEVAHWLHDRVTKFGFETDHRWKPTKEYLEKFPLSTNPEIKRRQIERHQAITELWKTIERTDSHQSRMKDMRARTPAAQLKELAKPRKIFARTVERVTAYVAGRKQPSYGRWDFYTTLTKQDMELLIPYVRRYLRSLE